MEREDLIQMLQVYKSRLADMEEQVIMFQVVISNQNKEKEMMRNQIENLESRLSDLTSQNEKEA